jgi:hypothetical protein
MFTHNEPLEALQLKQWHREHVVGNLFAAINMLTAPQLHFPLMIPEESMVMMFSPRTLRP